MSKNIALYGMVLSRLVRFATLALAALAGPLAAKARPASDHAVLDVPGRFQYDDNNGYCGEVTLQMLMLKHGAWIPQEAARKAGGGELLLGVNYDAAMDRLGIAYQAFTGRGYKPFVKWAKQQVRKGRGVVTVAYYRGGSDSDYDHIMPIVGVVSSTAGYSDADVLLVNSGYGTRPVRRRVDDYVCTARNKKDSIEEAGCVPKNTAWGYAILGPAYARGGPRTELAVDEPREPGVGRSTTMRGKVTARGLRPGQAYALHRVATPNGAPRGTGDRFVATADTHTVKVRFRSDTLAYFIVKKQF